MRLLDGCKASGLDRASHLTDNLSTTWGEMEQPAIPKPEYPRPQMVRKQYEILNGTWKYAVTKVSEYPGMFQGEIRVPFSPETKLSGVGRQLKPGEYLWYERTMDVHKPESGGRLLLHFGAVDQTCHVYINGKGAGGHEGGYLPFTLDITEYIREGQNILTVTVKDSSDASVRSRGKQKLKPGGIFYSAQSGIWQTVWTEWVPEIYIQTYRVTPVYDLDEIKLEVYAPGADSCRVTAAQDGEICARNVLKPDCRRPGWLKGHVSVGLLRPWTPETPFLYDLELQAGEDCVQGYFAMRCLTIEPNEAGQPVLCLNHEPYFQKGVLDQGYWPDSLMTAPCDAALIYDIQKMKSLGFNMLRKHCKIEEQRWYYHCDRLGMLVWQDMVNGGGPYDMKKLTYLPTVFPAGQKVKHLSYDTTGRKDKGGRDEWLRETKETIEALYNNPCIVIWVLFNEGWGQFDTEQNVEYVRGLDAGRLIDAASGWFDQGVGDLCSVHNYFRELVMPKDSRPSVISEFGGISYGEPGHRMTSGGYGYGKMKNRREWQEHFKALNDRIEELKAEGLSASVYTQLSDIEEEINGILTYDRKVCKMNPDRVLHLANSETGGGYAESSRESS